MRRLTSAPTPSGKHQRTLIALALSCLAMAAACGTRVSTAAIVKAEGGSGGQLASATPGNTAASGQSADNGAATATTALASGGAASSSQTAQNAGPSVAASGGSVSGSVSSGGAASSNASTSGACASQGSPLVLGQVLAASGLIGQDLGSAKPTLSVWAHYINDHFGGLACHPVQVYSEDDASDPGRSASDVNDLVQNKHAKALVANMVPISISGFRSALDQAKIPAIGGDLFTLDWNQDPLMYPVGTYVDANAYGSMQSLAAAGHTKVAVLYCVEAPICPSYKDAVVKYASKANATVVYTTSVSITQPDYTSVCQSAKNAGATQLAMILDGAAIGRLARSCEGIGYVVPYSVASLGATYDKQDPNVRAMTVTVASAAVPWFRSDSPAESEFQSAMKTYAPSLTLDPTTILTWADGMMVKAAIDKLGPSARNTDITAEMILRGLTQIQNETLGGLIAPQSYNPQRGANPPNMCYFPALFDGNGNWNAPLGTKFACLS